MAFSLKNSGYFNDSDEDIFWQLDNNTKEGKVFETAMKDRERVGKAKLQGGDHKGVYLKGYSAIYSLKDKDMGRVVLYGIPKESRGAGKQGVVLPYGQGPFCVYRRIHKMH